MKNKTYGLIVLLLILLCNCIIGTAQEDELIRKTGLWRYSYQNDSGSFKQFDKLYKTDKKTHELYLKYLRTRRTQRIINYSCAGAFVGVGLARVLLGINPNQNDYILFDLGLTLHVVAVVGGLTVILTNAIVLPIQSIRKKRIISQVNNRDIGVLTNDHQISFALGVKGIGVGFWLTF